VTSEDQSTRITATGTTTSASGAPTPTATTRSSHNHCKKQQRRLASFRDPRASGARQSLSHSLSCFVLLLDLGCTEHKRERDAVILCNDGFKPFSNFLCERAPLCVTKHTAHTHMHTVFHQRCPRGHGAAEPVCFVARPCFFPPSHCAACGNF
jgi:hypothetical protein